MEIEEYTINEVLFMINEECNNRGCHYTKTYFFNHLMNNLPFKLKKILFDRLVVLETSQLYDKMRSDICSIVDKE